MRYCNYWYVEASKGTETTRYPNIGTLSFTVSAAPSVTADSENPADGATVSPDSSGEQQLQVAVSNTDTCHIYYQDEDDSGFTDSGEVSAYEDGGTYYCDITVPYNDHMDNNGTNNWYVEATNSTATTRYPSSGTLSFTVSEDTSFLLLFLPAILQASGGASE